MTLDNNVEKQLADAKTFAERGSVLSRKYALSLASGYAQKVGCLIFISAMESDILSP